MNREHRYAFTISGHGPWPILLASPLPSIPVPLKHNDADAHLDLQQLLASAYERRTFDLRIDYAVDPVPPLTVGQATWA